MTDSDDDYEYDEEEEEEINPGYASEPSVSTAGVNTAPRLRRLSLSENELEESETEFVKD